MRGTCLPGPGDIVFFAFDGHQPGFVYRLEMNDLAPMGKLTLGEIVVLENTFNGFEIILRRQIHDRAIFIVEGPMLGSTVAITSTSWHNLFINTRLS